MINLHDVLSEVPRFKTFCSVKSLHNLVEELRGNNRFAVSTAGHSVGSLPIHHVSFGVGAVKALVVAGPHCHEPIGSMTVFSLMKMAQAGNNEILDTGVEWHVVPCIDPDGAILNEGWTQKSFDARTYLRHFHLQPPQDQVDFTFPVSHKKLRFDQPSTEAKVLMGIIDKVRPTFYYSLHNAALGSGAFFYLTRDIGLESYEIFYELLSKYRIPLCTRALPGRVAFADGVFKRASLSDYYDYLEARPNSSSPEELLAGMGASAPEYLQAHVLSLTTELPYVRYKRGASALTKRSFRQLRLRMDADNKYLVSLILKEWEDINHELDSTSPFFRKINHEVASMKEKLHEGLFPTWSFENTKEVMFGEDVAGDSGLGDELVSAYLLHRFVPLCHGYEFVRLLKASTQTARVRRALDRLEAVFEDALEELNEVIDFSAMEPIECQDLAKVQVGCGVIAINSILQQVIS